LQALELVTVSSTGALYRRIPPHSTTGSLVAQFTDPSQPVCDFRDHRRRANLMPALYHNPCEHKAIPHFIVKAQFEARLPNTAAKLADRQLIAQLRA
jgi:hypothetical protein